VSPDLRRDVATACACLFWGTIFGALLGFCLGSPLVGAGVGYIGGAVAMWSRLAKSVCCLGFGMVYGAVCGAICAPSLIWMAARGHLPIWPTGPLYLDRMSAALIRVFYGEPRIALIGVLCGAVSGGLFGLLGSFARGPAGWCLVGALAGYLMPSLWAQPPFEHPSLWFSEWNVLPALIAGSLGLAIGGGLRSDRSRLPGVRRLRKVLHEESRPRGQAPPPAVPAEVTPSLAPAGRGDETTPAREHRRG
jgi:hypothetical protein